MSREGEIVELGRLTQEVNSLREQNREFAEYIKSSSLSPDVYFAGKALEAILSNPDLIPNIQHRNWEDRVVRDAWRLADRMVQYHRMSDKDKR